MPQQQPTQSDPIAAPMPTLIERRTWTFEELAARAQGIGLTHQPDRGPIVWRAPRRLPRWLGWLRRLRVIAEPQERHCRAPLCGHSWPCEAYLWAVRAEGLDVSRY